jgi:hypothetical protein
MMTKFANLLVVLSAVAGFGFAPTSALAESVKDVGGYDATYTKRDSQPIPDQDGHVLILTDASGIADSPGGLVDGFSVTERQIADLRQGNGPQQGYVMFSKGSDQLIVQFEGNVTTTLKDGKPNTTMKGKYVFVSATGALAGMQGEGSYSGHFTAEDKCHIDWTGTRTIQKDALVSTGKN